MKKSKNYRVRWEIDVPAWSPAEAALLALRIMRDPDQIGLCFDVVQVGRGAPLCDDCKTVKRMARIDLEEYVVCDDCGLVFKLDSLDWEPDMIHGLLDRVAPGGMVPFCECPECGSLAYPASKMADGPTEEIVVEGGQ